MKFAINYVDFEIVKKIAEGGMGTVYLAKQKGVEGFEKTVSLWPQTKDFIGSLILSDLSHQIEQQQSLQQISVFEAELAAQAAWKNKTEEHKVLLDRLSNIQKFQTIQY